MTDLHVSSAAPPAGSSIVPSSDDVAARLKGAPGTSVTLTLRRPGKPEPVAVTATRAEIPNRSVANAFLHGQRLASQRGLVHAKRD